MRHSCARSTSCIAMPSSAMRLGGTRRPFDTQQLLDIVFTVGNYNLVSMALNTLGVRLDEDIPGFD